MGVPQRNCFRTYSLPPLCKLSLICNNYAKVDMYADDAAISCFADTVDEAAKA